jgi:hypothetical protein
LTFCFKPLRKTLAFIIKKLIQAHNGL